MSPNSWPRVSCALDGSSIPGLPVTLPGHQRVSCRYLGLAGLVSRQRAMSPCTGEHHQKNKNLNRDLRQCYSFVAQPGLLRDGRGLICSAVNAALSSPSAAGWCPAIHDVAHRTFVEKQREKNTMAPSVGPHSYASKRTASSTLCKIFVPDVILVEGDRNIYWCTQRDDIYGCVGTARFCTKQTVHAKLNGRTPSRLPCPCHGVLLRRRATAQSCCSFFRACSLIASNGSRRMASINACDRQMLRLVAFEDERRRIH